MKTKQVFQGLQASEFCVVNVNSTVVFKHFEDLKNLIILNILKEKSDIGYVKSVNSRTFHSTDTTICVYKMLQTSAHWETVIINIEGSIIPSV